MPLGKGRWYEKNEIMLVKHLGSNRGMLRAFNCSSNCPYCFNLSVYFLMMFFISAKKVLLFC